MIRERKYQYVLKTDVLFKLIKNERRLEGERERISPLIAEKEVRGTPLATPVAPTTSAGFAQYLRTLLVGLGLVGVIAVVAVILSREFAVPPDALSRLFAILRDNLRCVVLNACYSEPQAQAIAAHIDCVIGMPDAIGDAASLNFAASFYQALAYGRDVQTAFDLGCNRIDLQALDEPGKPKLLAQRSDPRQVVFVAFQQTSVSSPAPVASALSPSQRRLLETQLTEFEKRHATLTKRIDALNTDIGRELDSERKLALQERRQELVDERQQVSEQLAIIEKQLGR